MQNENSQIEDLIHTHLFNIESASLPGCFIKVRTIKFFLINKYSPVLILKEPDRINSLKQDRYKWYYEDMSLLKSLAYANRSISNEINRLILKKEDLKEIKNIDNELKLAKIDKDLEEYTIVTNDLFVSENEEGFILVSNDPPSPENRWIFNCFNSKNNLDYNLYTIQYNDMYLSVSEDVKTSEKNLILQPNSYLWKIHFKEKRSISKSQIEILEKLRLKKTKENNNLEIEDKILKLSPTDLCWFWDISCQISIESLGKKYDIHNMIFKLDEFGNNGLMKSILSKHDHLFKFIFENCTNEELEKLLSRKNKSKQTPLHLAAYLGNEQMLGMIIDKNVIKLNSIDIFGATPLMDAVMNNKSLKNVKQLLNAKPSLIFTKNFNQQNVFHIAAKKDNIEIFQLLLTEDKSGLNSVDNYGLTPLDYSKKYNQKEIKKLIKNSMNN